MLKGVFVGFGVMFVVLLIPIIHPIMFAAGPFIGGYYGIRSVDVSQASPGRKALEFGAWTGVLTLLMFAIIAGVLSAIFDFSGVGRTLLWGAVGVLTFYYGSMSGLGAWYAELKAQG